MSSRTQASQGVHSVDVHRAAATDTLSATPAEGQGWVQLVLNSHQCVENHGSGLVQIQRVGLHARLLCWVVGVLADSSANKTWCKSVPSSSAKVSLLVTYPSVDLELLHVLDLGVALSGGLLLWVRLLNRSGEGSGRRC